LADKPYTKDTKIEAILVVIQTMIGTSRDFGGHHCFSGRHPQRTHLAGLAAQIIKLLPREAGRYKTYFPKIKLICP